jgi:hypothetical protein
MTNLLVQCTVLLTVRERDSCAIHEFYFLELVKLLRNNGKLRSVAVAVLAVSAKVQGPRSKVQGPRSKMTRRITTLRVSGRRSSSTLCSMAMVVPIVGGNSRFLKIMS